MQIDDAVDDSTIKRFAFVCKFTNSLSSKFLAKKFV